MPKSVTLTRPSSSTMTLCGLKSRWMTPRLWAKRAARRTWMVMSIARPGSSGPSSRDQLLERAALEELHRDVVGAVELAAVEDLDDVGVLQAGGGARLAAEALDELRVGGEAAVEDLQRDLAAELGVLGAVDVGHAAAADALDDRVALVDDLALAEALAQRVVRVSHPGPPASPWRSARRRCRPCPPCSALDDDRDGVLVGEADEPQVVEAVVVELGRAGLAGEVDPAQGRRGAGALLDHLLHHRWSARRRSSSLITRSASSGSCSSVVRPSSSVAFSTR